MATLSRQVARGAVFSSALSLCRDLWLTLRGLGRDEVNTDVHYTDGPHTDGPHTDGPHTDGPHTDGPHTDEPQGMWP